MAELFANLARTTLAANIDNIQTTITVASVNLFPATGNFRIVVDTEIMLVTSVNAGANQFNVVRAAEGPYAASSHKAPANVIHILTKASIALAGTTVSNVLVSSGTISNSNPYTQTITIPYSTPYHHFQLLLSNLYMIGGSTTFQSLYMQYAGDTSASYTYRSVDNGTFATGTATTSILLGHVNGTSYQVFAGNPVKAMCEVWFYSGTTTNTPTITVRSNFTTATAPGTVSTNTFTSEGLYFGTSWVGNNTITITLAGQMSGDYELWGYN